MSFFASLSLALLSIALAVTAGYGVSQFEKSKAKLDARAVVSCIFLSLVFVVAALMIAVSAK